MPPIGQIISIGFSLLKLLPEAISLVEQFIAAIHQHGIAQVKAHMDSFKPVAGSSGVAQPPDLKKE